LTQELSESGQIGIGIGIHPLQAEVHRNRNQQDPLHTVFEINIAGRTKQPPAPHST
jgi:hypothetical protein